VSFSFVEYLAVKKTVDDRALNRAVLQSLSQNLPAGRPLRVLEVAAGVGTMLQRLVEWDILRDAEYTALDISAECVAAAKTRLPDWAARHGFQSRWDADGALVLQREAQWLRVIFEVADVTDFVARDGLQSRWDLLIAHAFFDLVDISALLPGLLSLLKSGGLYYFTVNFDADTIFVPELDPVLDRQVIDLYHRAMARQHVNNVALSGPAAGRYLFQHLRAAGSHIIAAGSSDWVVFPGPTGYPAREAFFLHCIIDSIGGMVAEPASFDVSPWLAQRHNQIAQNELVYIAHNLDFVGRVTG
jgi:SAM-dependent methyltransferase